jgi:hypothetical protein
MSTRTRTTVCLIAAAALLLASCAAGNERFTAEDPAGFWYGLWHGIIVVVAFIVSLFSETVRIYEPHNAGAWYDFGFVLGIVFISGGCFKSRARRKPRKCSDDEWEEIAKGVERKVMSRLEHLADAPEGDAKEAPREEKPASKPDPEWEEIGRKIEQKIKRKLRQWADEE